MDVESGSDTTIDIWSKKPIDDARSYVFGGTAYPEDLWAAGHEAGLLLGLPDRYVDLPGVFQVLLVPFGLPRSVPLPVWENDIMANAVAPPIGA